MGACVICSNDEDVLYLDNIIEFDDDSIKFSKALINSILF